MVRAVWYGIGAWWLSLGAIYDRNAFMCTLSVTNRAWGSGDFKDVIPGRGLVGAAKAHPWAVL